VTYRAPPWRWPLFLQILLSLLLGLALGLALGPAAGTLEVPAKLVLRMLGALAPPLVFVAVVRALLTTFLDGRTVLKLGSLLVQNTLAAIAIGLLVSQLIRPGDGAHLDPGRHASRPETDILEQILENIPDSLARPFVDNRVIALVILAVAIGIAARQLHTNLQRLTEQFFEMAYSILLTILGWVLKLVPLAVFAKVAAIVGVSGFSPFVRLGWFVVAVLCALLLQAFYYLTRVRLGSWVRPLPLFRALRDPLVMAFSTASSTLTMPVTYDRLLHGVGLRERSASLGALVGANFNNDGTALYEAMAALFVAQSLGMDLPLSAQILIVLTSVVASVGAAGIPEAGLVTMTLVFSAVNLPTDMIALLLTVDWFLDRARTTVNVLGDVTVACLIDGRQPKEATSAALPLAPALP
jgi:Na+/H+-dicarboxylate symporter